ncbi:MAG: SDR family oxidoreductase, partial [Fibrobacter sp.]|nr:SDR family oxidoreductase [Fibrobacter sp.]
MDQVNNSKSIEDINKCISVLECLIENSSMLGKLSEEQRIKLMVAAGKLSRPDRHEAKKRNKEINRVKKQETVQKERKNRALTGIRRAREIPVFSAPKQIEHHIDPVIQNQPELDSPRTCYVCKKEFTRLHHFYDTMCMECGDFNYRKRFQTAPLHGQVAVITGSRLKIGYQATLMMLRAGAKVIATTRFPVDSALRFSREEDFGQWGDRLQIFGLDLRHTPSVELFCGFLENKLDRLDILINNAAQTVRR